MSVADVDRLLTVKDQMMQNAQHFVTCVYISNQFSVISSWKILVRLRSGMNDVLLTPAVLQLTLWVGLCFVGTCTFHWATSLFDLAFL